MPLEKMKVLDSFSLKGKTAVVTGGAGLYGYQIVTALAEAGAVVYVASRNKANNEQRLAPLLREGYDVRIREVDLESEKSILALCDTVYSECDRVDILVNNAVLRSMTSYKDTAQSFERSFSIALFSILDI